MSSHRLLDPETESRRSRRPSWAVWAAVAAVLVALVVAVVVLVRSNDPVPVPSITTPAGAPVVPATPAPATVTHDPSVPVYPDLPENAVSGDPENLDGYRVGPGLDLPAGKYTTAGAIDGSVLDGQWSRSRARSAPNGIPETAPSAPTVVAANSSRGPTTVTLRDGDIFFTRGYKPWHRVP